jgi:outer membrane protein TolC
MESLGRSRWTARLVGCGVLLGCLASLLNVVFAQDPRLPRIAPSPGSPSAARAEDLPSPRTVLPPDAPAAGGMTTLPPPTLKPRDEIFPINLPTALKLANARAWDIDIAVQQLRVATAQFQGASVLWLPTVFTGVDWNHHDGPIQNNDGTVTYSSRSSLYVGTEPFLIVNISDAIFTPLAQRQVQRAQQANVQTATNDTLTAVAEVYFNALEARADLVALEDVARRVGLLVHKTESLAPGLVPTVEVARVRAARFAVAQALPAARQRWRVASAEVARVLRLKANVLIEPLEPPHLRVTLVPPALSTDELIPIAIQTRPELTYQQALVEEAQQKLRQEKWRPLLPIIMTRGQGTQTPYPMAFGGFAADTGSNLGPFQVRSDWDLQALWELRNLGFGNLALIRERRANLDLARDRAFRFRDFVAKEVTQTWAEMTAADERVGLAEQELRQALRSADENYQGLGEVKRAGGNIVVLIIRPLEVVAALQALMSAYFNYFGTVADYNRAQFRLYRALGNPAQELAGRDGVCGPPLTVPAPAAAAPASAAPPQPR